VKLTSRSGNNHLARSRLFVGLGTKLFTIQARRKNHSSTGNRIPSIGKAEVCKLLPEKTMKIHRYIHPNCDRHEPPPLGPAAAARSAFRWWLTFPRRGTERIGSVGLESDRSTDLGHLKVEVSVRSTANTL